MQEVQGSRKHHAPYQHRETPHILPTHSALPNQVGVWQDKGLLEDLAVKEYLASAPSAAVGLAEAEAIANTTSLLVDETTAVPEGNC